MDGDGWAIWFTGRPASGKTTLARAVRHALQERGISTILIDSDELRRVMTLGATYAPAERDLFYNQLVELAVWLIRSGERVLIAAMAASSATGMPSARSSARALLRSGCAARSRFVTFATRRGCMAAQPWV
jgi:adenylylsulfate kinase-like enzyme